MVNKVKTLVWSKLIGRDGGSRNELSRSDGETSLEFILRVMKSFDKSMGEAPLVMYTGRQWLVDTSSMTALKIYTERDPTYGTDYVSTLFVEIQAI